MGAYVKKQLAVLLAAAAPLSLRCPAGHALPHRTSSGRCTPAECVGGPAPVHVPAAVQKALEKTVDEVLDKKSSDLVEQAAAEERTFFARAAARKHVRDTMHPPPRLAPLPTTADPKELAKKRLADLVPLALHEKEWALQYGGISLRQEVASEILDRVGMTRKKVDEHDGRGPVLLVQINAGAAPWDAQPKTVVGMKVTDGKG